MRLFWSKGYHATSLKDLEAALDMRPGSIYAAFKSKEGLFREALGVYFTRMAATFDAVVMDSASPLNGLANFVANQVETVRKSPPDPACLLLKTTLELSSADDAAGCEARAYLTQMGERFRTALDHAVAQGELPTGTDTPRLARRLQVKLFGFVLVLQKETDPDTVSLLAEDLRQEILGLAQDAAA